MDFPGSDGCVVVAEGRWWSVGGGGGGDEGGKSWMAVRSKRVEELLLKTGGGSIAVDEGGDEDSKLPATACLIVTPGVTVAGTASATGQVCFTASPSRLLVGGNSSRGYEPPAV